MMLRHPGFSRERLPQGEALTLTAALHSQREFQLLRPSPGFFRVYILEPQEHSSATDASRVWGFNLLLYLRQRGNLAAFSCASPPVPLGVGAGDPLCGCVGTASAALVKQIGRDVWRRVNRWLFLSYPVPCHVPRSLNLDPYATGCGTCSRPWTFCSH